MSKAYRCNRCGEFFSPLAMLPDELIASIPRIIYKNRKTYVNNSFDHGWEDIDLCPKCTALFDVWMREAERLAEITDPLVRKDGV